MDDSNRTLEIIPSNELRLIPLYIIISHIYEKIIEKASECEFTYAFIIEDLIHKYYEFNRNRNKQKQAKAWILSVDPKYFDKPVKVKKEDKKELINKAKTFAILYVVLGLFGILFTIQS